MTIEDRRTLVEFLKRAGSPKVVTSYTDMVLAIVVKQLLYEDDIEPLRVADGDGRDTP